jgi:catechol 2,3-dioxygenase-like lactoylglutathione lyase family enzyme
MTLGRVDILHGPGGTVFDTNQAVAQELPFAPELSGLVTFLYCNDLAKCAAFYQTMLGREPELDWGWVKIYRIASAASIGLVDKGHGLNNPSPQKPVTLSFMARSPAEIDAWFTRLVAMHAEICSAPKWEAMNADRRAMYTVLCRDPEGYLLEIFVIADSVLP